MIKLKPFLLLCILYYIGSMRIHAMESINTSVSGYIEGFSSFDEFSGNFEMIKQTEPNYIGLNVNLENDYRIEANGIYEKVLYYQRIKPNDHPNSRFIIQKHPINQQFQLKKVSLSGFKEEIFYPPDLNRERLYSRVIYQGFPKDEENIVKEMRDEIAIDTLEEVLQIKDENFRLKLMMQKIQNENDHLKKIIELKDEKMIVCEKLDAHFVELNKSNEDYRKENENLQIQSEHLKKITKNLQEDISKMKLKTEGMQKENESMAEDKNKLDDIHSKLKGTLKKYKNNAEEQIQKFKLEKEELSTENLHLKEELTQLKLELVGKEELRSQHVNLTDQFMKLNAELEKYTKSNESLEKKNKDFEEKVSILESSNILYENKEEQKNESYKPEISEIIISVPNVQPKDQNIDFESVDIKKEKSKKKKKKNKTALPKITGSNEVEIKSEAKLETTKIGSINGNVNDKKEENTNALILKRVLLAEVAAKCIKSVCLKHNAGEEKNELQNNSHEQIKNSKEFNYVGMKKDKTIFEDEYSFLQENISTEKENRILLEEDKRKKVEEVVKDLQKKLEDYESKEKQKKEIISFMEKEDQHLQQRITQERLLQNKNYSSKMRIILENMDQFKKKMNNGLDDEYWKEKKDLNYEHIFMYQGALEYYKEQLYKLWQKPKNTTFDKLGNVWWEEYGRKKYQEMLMFGFENCNKDIPKLKEILNQENKKLTQKFDEFNEQRKDCLDCNKNVEDIFRNINLPIVKIKTNESFQYESMLWDYGYCHFGANWILYMFKENMEKNEKL